jgi:tripartite-type tricarboxylate transporter receptor subunit TctC
VPTVAESGVPGFEATGWLALFAPGATPRDIVMRLNAEIVRALNMPDVRERIAANAESPHPTSPEELTRFVRAETEKWAKVIQAAGIKLDL